MIIEKNICVLLDKNVTSRIQEIIKAYKDLCGKEFNKITGITESDLLVFHNHENNKYKDFAHDYKRLKELDKKEVLLNPFFCILEKAHQHTSYDSADSIPVRNIDATKAKEYADEELKIIESFFVYASTGELTQEAISTLTNPSHLSDQVLLWQDSSIKDMKAINDLFKKKKELSEIENETKKRFNNPIGNMYKLMILLSIHNDPIANGVTKIAKTTEKKNKQFNPQNFFFDTFFIYKILDNNYSIKLFNDIFKTTRESHFITLDKPLNEYISQHYTPELTSLTSIELPYSTATEKNIQKNVQLIIQTLKSQGRNISPKDEENINSFIKHYALCVKLKPSNALRNSSHFKYIEYLFNQ